MQGGSILAVVIIIRDSGVAPGDLGGPGSPGGAVQKRTLLVSLELLPPFPEHLACAGQRARRALGIISLSVYSHFMKNGAQRGGVSRLGLNSRARPQPVRSLSELYLVSAVGARPHL